MLRQFLGDIDLFVLPLIAMALFVAIFVTVLVRVCQRSRAPEYRRMASLPLEQDPRQEQLR